MKAKEITQKNKDLDLRRWGKNVYSKASNSDNTEDAYNYIGMFWNQLTKTEFGTPLAYAIVSTSRSGTNREKSEDIIPFSSISIEDIKMVAENNQTQAIALFYSAEDSDYIGETDTPVFLTGYYFAPAEGNYPPVASFDTIMYNGVSGALFEKYTFEKNGISFVGVSAMYPN